MVSLTAYLLMFTILLLLGGPPLVKKFLRGKFVGMDVYIILTINGKTVAFRNPRSAVGHEDQPLDMVPNELFYSDRFGEYYNVCWFEYGALFRCGHSVHRTPEEAQSCKLTKIQGHLIGRILEEQ